MDRKTVSFGRHRTGPQTPWGTAQDATTYAPGVVNYSTSSHGGLVVKPEVLATWNEDLRRYEPFAGPGAFEEDEDWAVVCAAMPRLFEAINHHHALATLQRMDNPRIKRFLDSVEGKGWITLVSVWRRDNGRCFTMAGGGTNKTGWSQRWRSIDGKSEAITFHTGGFMQVEWPTLPTAEELTEQFGPTTTVMETEERKAVMA